jgi:uncharacterized protein YjiS (DUF1127 family)
MRSRGAVHRGVVRHAAVRQPSSLAIHLLRIVEHLQSWQERARERHALAGLDDRALQDCGASRCLIASEAAKRFWRP